MLIAANSNQMIKIVFHQKLAMLHFYIYLLFYFDKKIVLLHYFSQEMLFFPSAFVYSVITVNYFYTCLAS